MSWESATKVLYAESPTLEQVTALSDFIGEHSDELKQCYAPQYKHLRPTLAQFVSQLFILLERSTETQTEVVRKLNQAVEKAATYIIPDNFFPGLFHYALHDADESLLELVYSSLFTEIVFNSSLTSLWFKERVSAKQNSVKFSPLAWALDILTSIQFLDLRQDWESVKPNSDLLLAIDQHVSQSNESFLQLVWSLALFFMARQHYKIDTEGDGIEIEPLMEKLQTQSGTHWSSVLQDRIQMSVSGLNTVMEALQIIRSSSALSVVSEQLFSQTAADVVSCIATISKPTPALCAALAMAISNYPDLQREQWIPEQYIALVKAKAPATISELVSIAQTLKLDKRVEYLREMHTYLCEVSVNDLDIGVDELDSDLIGQSVRTANYITVLPPRISDHQGTLELDIGTRGTLLGFEGTDCLVMWYFNYNGWSLLGRILENADLIEGLDWKPLTLEILKLTTITTGEVSVLSAMSAGLARGDIVDLVAQRLQLWIHNGYDKSPRAEYVDQAFEFLAHIAALDASRVWVLLYKMTWSTSDVVLNGVRKLLMAVWSSYDKSLKLHVAVADKVAQLFASQYLALENFDPSVLSVLELILPVSELLQEGFLSGSDLRETAVAPLLSNLDKKEVLAFCILCLQLISGEYSSRLLKQQNVMVMNRKQAYIERQLFAQSSQLATLFMTKPELRQWILNLWTMLVENPDAPSLLAFLSSQQVKDLKAEFANIAANKLESAETIGDLAQFLAASCRQEGLLDLLRTSIMPSIEKRVTTIENPVSRCGIIEALKLCEVALQPATIDTLVQIIETESEDKDYINMKIAAIELLVVQMKITPKSLESFAASIGALTPKVAISDASSAWCGLVLEASVKADYISKPRKLDWARRLLEANSNQPADDVRTETALCIATGNSGPSLEILQLLYTQLSELTTSATNGLATSRARLVALLKISALLLAKFTSSDAELTALIHELLEVVMIKQFQVFGITEEFLKPQLVILQECLRLLDNNAPKQLMQGMVETASDLVVLCKFGDVTVDNPQFGELLMFYILEWLPIDSICQSFVRNGLMNVLIEAPLSRHIQKGDVTPYTQPLIHSLWRNGILTVVLRLLHGLKARISQEVWLFMATYSAQISTCNEQWKSGIISLALIDETMLLYALISQLKKCDANPNDIVDLKVENEDLLKTVDFLMSHQKYLAERLYHGEKLSSVLSAMEDLKDILCITN